MLQFEDYCIKNCEKTASDFDELYHKIKQILCLSILAAKNKIDRRLGCFELLGCDILLDEHFNPYLLEINFNPAIYTDCQA